MFLKRISRILVTLGASLLLFCIVAIVTIFIEYLGSGKFSPRHIFRVNFYAATILLFAGLMVEFFPVFLPRSKLLDHSTHGEYFVKKREEKSKRAFKLVRLGFGTLFVTAISQYILSLII